MPRFYFHSRDHRRLIRDARGIELENLTEAHDEAIKAIREMLIEALAASPELVSFEIGDEDGNTRLLVTPQEALGKDKQLRREFVERIKALRRISPDR